MYENGKYLNSGEKALVIEFGNEISKDANMKVRAMMLAIEEKKFEFIVEMVPTYRSLMIHYDPLKTQYDEMVDMFKKIEKDLMSIDIPLPNVIEIPVCYGDEYGEDLDNVANHNSLAESEVIDIHTSREYLIYMIGFTPGFPYLGGMDDRIATPRLEKPRIKINGGSVGIAGSQTGVYPVDSPGGWQIIGRTPLKLYDSLREKPILLKTGDYIKFISISKDEFLKIEDMVNENKYQVKVYPMKEVSENC